MSLNFKDPQTAQWNVTLERQLTAATAIRISYAGMNSYRMNVKEDYNAIPPSKVPYVPSPYVDPRAPYQNWIELNYSANAAFANYQGLTVEATHRLSRGLSFQGNYTWAKNLSDAQGDAPGGFASENLLFTPSYDQFDLRAARGNVAGMPRQRFLLTGTYQLPFGPGRGWAIKSKVVRYGIGWLEREHGYSLADRALSYTHHQPHRGSIEHRHRGKGRVSRRGPTQSEVRPLNCLPARNGT